MPLAKLNMIPFRYPWAYKMHEEGWNNTWIPQQIAMGYDRADLHTMPPELMHIYKTNLANLTTSDVQIMDNVNLGIQLGLIKLGILDAPEIRMYLCRQADEESLHTKSYQFILESIGMDYEAQAQFYTLWQREPSMKAKVDWAGEITQGLLLAAEPTLQQFVMGAAFYYAIYEGAWFFGGFSPNFAIFHFHNKTRGTADQLEYILRDESMHIAFGLKMINTIREEEIAAGRPDPLDPHQFMTMADMAVNLEREYARFLLPSAVLGYNADLHVEFLQFLLNRRARQLGMDEIYQGVSNPLPWRSQFETKKEKNFFETHVSEYATGAELTWD